MRIYNKQVFKHRRQKLRRKATEAEDILWQYLRGKKLGYKFWRQYSVGSYILDFYSPELHLGVELDGGGHKEILQKQYDKDREQYLDGLGIKVLRFWNSEVKTDLIKVLRQVKEASHPAPPQAESTLP